MIPAVTVRVPPEWGQAKTPKDQVLTASFSALSLQFKAYVGTWYRELYYSDSLPNVKEYF